MLSRFAAALLAAGLPVGLLLWQWVANLPELPDDMTTVQQLVNDVSWAVRILAVLVLVQALLALWYQVWLSFRWVRYGLVIGEAPRSAPLLRLQSGALVVWLVVTVGLGITLGVLTDWLYEVPVPKPAPGELLYATSFEDFNDEWDIFPGLGIVSSDFQRGLVVVAGRERFQRRRRGGCRAYGKYGSGAVDEVMCSLINRKFNDLDVRVTARLVDGPVDQNQFGATFVTGMARTSTSSGSVQTVTIR